MSEKKHVCIPIQGALSLLSLFKGSTYPFTIFRKVYIWSRVEVGGGGIEGVAYLTPTKMQDPKTKLLPPSFFFLKTSLI